MIELPAKLYIYIYVNIYIFGQFSYWGWSNSYMCSICRSCIHCRITHCIHGSFNDTNCKSPLKDEDYRLFRNGNSWNPLQNSGDLFFFYCNSVVDIHVCVYGWMDGWMYSISIFMWQLRYKQLLGAKASPPGSRQGTHKALRFRRFTNGHRVGLSSEPVLETAAFVDLSITYIYVYICISTCVLI
jgi:hypothetical protein